MERVDVAVIGASAAGLAAAWSAARAGASVALLEAKPVIGQPPAPAIVGFDFLWPEAVPRPKHTVRRRLAGIQLRASNGRGPVIEAPLTLFDRARFDEHLVAEAQKAGARIVTGASDLRVDDDLTIHASGEALHPKRIVFADGAHTIATRFLRTTRDPDALAWGAILELRAQGDSDRLLLTLGPHAPGGRSQLNPLGSGAWSHWTFFRGDPSSAETIARRALALDAALQGWREVEAKFVGVAPDPVYRMPGQLARGRVLVAGGAAGQGGLEVGLASGWMAGEAAARADDVRSYERAWRSRYQKGYRRLRRAADTIAHLTDREVRALLDAWDGAALPPAPSARLLLERPRGALALGWAAFLGQART